MPTGADVTFERFGWRSGLYGWWTEIGHCITFVSEISATNLLDAERLYDINGVAAFV